MVRTTSGTMAGSQASTRPPARRVKPVLNPPSANRTVLPECRLKRSRAQSSRCKSLFRTRACTAEGAKKRSEEHTSELQSLMRNSYAVFCLKKKTNKQQKQYINDERMRTQIREQNNP